MKIYSIYDKEFREYGKVIKGIDCKELINAMNNIEMPSSGVCYQPGIGSLEACNVYDDFFSSVFGGMPVQLGMCWGYNTKLNCLEYHRDSEFNLGVNEFILLLAKQSDIDNFMLDTSTVKAFKVPAGVLIEVFATTLHYAPCHTNPLEGFRVLVALPKGTNTEKPLLKGLCNEEKYLTARNKWLLPHPDSDEAKNGAVVGLTGVNIDIIHEI